MNREPLHITSIHNPKIKEAIKLWDKRDRDRTRKFIIEGFREITRAADSSRVFEELFTCPELFLGENEDELITLLQKRGTRIYTCTPTLFKKLSYRDRPDGLIAIAPQKHLALNELELSKNPFLVVAESIEKPGNLGTILRSSDAVGVDGLIVVDPCTDIHNPNVIRASVGTLFTIPVIEANGDETLQWLQNHNISILAATPKAKKEYTEVDMSGPIAIVVGTEQLGLSDKWMKEANLQVRIPMVGVADSLNVAMATTLLLYEALRQRRPKQ